VTAADNESRHEAFTERDMCKSQLMVVQCDIFQQNGSRKGQTGSDWEPFESRTELLSEMQTVALRLFCTE
jgi:hypothetical protein